MFCYISAEIADRFKELRDGQLSRRNERNVAFHAAGPVWGSQSGLVPAYRPVTPL
jgi:hypothetical protein